jgi:lysozyme family protein
MPSWGESEKQKIRSLILTAKITKDVSYYKRNIIPKIIANRARYKFIADKVGCPLAMIPLIHCKELTSDIGVFKAYLGNGQPISRVTTIVPKGRGPFKTWESGALDALHLDGIDKVTDWSLEKMFYLLEGFNGYGYRYKGINSPYIWAFTNQYSRGLYTSDGKYSPTVVSTNIGCFALYKALIAADPSFAFDWQEELPLPVAETPGWLDKLKVAALKILDVIFENAQKSESPIKSMKG